MTWVFKAAVFFWPFIREFILGDVTMKDAIKNNKFKFFVACTIVFSFVLNLFMIERLWTISSNYLVLKEKYTKQSMQLIEVEKIAKQNTDKLKGVLLIPPVTNTRSDDNTSPVAAANNYDKRKDPPRSKGKAHSVDEERLRRLQKRFNDIKNTEQVEP